MPLPGSLVAAQADDSIWQVERLRLGGEHMGAPGAQDDGSEHSCGGGRLRAITRPAGIGAPFSRAATQSDALVFAGDDA